MFATGRDTRVRRQPCVDTTIGGFASAFGLGIKSIFFTIIGPLINPAGAPRHVLGVYQPGLVGMVADVVAQLEMQHVLVVHGLDSLDEISILGRTSVAEVKGDKVERYEIAPEDFGFARASLEDVAGGSPEFNAEVLRGLFEGTDTGPIIAQQAVPVLPGDTEATLAARVHAEEHALYPRVVKAIANGVVQLDGRRVTLKEEL